MLRTAGKSFYYKRKRLLITVVEVLMNTSGVRGILWVNYLWVNYCLGGPMGASL